jgi:hypothetical protein
LYVGTVQNHRCTNNGDYANVDDLTLPFGPGRSQEDREAL